MKIFNRLLSALLALCMVATAFMGLITIETADHVHADETTTPESTVTAEPDDEDLVGASVIRKAIYKSDAEKLATMCKTDKDGKLVPYISAYGFELYVQPATGEVAIKNTATGQVLFTNPYDANQHVSSAASSAATATAWEQIVSQLSIEYTDNKGATKTLSSYKDAAEQDQITVTYVKNGISVNYTIGRSDARRICPMSTTRDFFETQVLAYIQDENDAKRLYPQLYVLYDSLSGTQPESVLKEWIDRRPILAKMELYVLNEKATNQEKNRVEGILKAWCPHITYETIDEQHTLTEYVATASVLPCFRMSLIYKLDENGVTVKLPANSIVFNEDHYTLKNVTVLPYMGAGNTANGGFNFIPDGTGSIIEFEDIGTSSVLLTGTLYGADYAYHTLPTSFTGKSEIMRFPVFGVVENKVVVDRFFIDDDNDPSNDKPYCTHSYTEVVTAPTCTEGGYTIATCTKCSEDTPGHTKKINETPATHTYDEAVEGSIVIVPTTCQQIGKTTYTCTVCKDVKVVEDVELGTHEYEATPHPTELGVSVYTCKVCGDSYEVGHGSSDHNLVALGSLTAVCKDGVYAGLKGTTYIYKNNTLTLYIEPTHLLKYQVGSKITLSNGVKGTVKAIDYRTLLKADIQTEVEAAGGVFGMTAPSDLKRHKVIIEVAISDLSAIVDASNAFTFDLEMKKGNGYTLKMCLECGYTVKTNVSEHNFKKDTTASTDPKCSPDGLTDGVTVYKCANEGCTAEKKVTVEAAHKWSDAGVATGVYKSTVDGHILTQTEIGQVWVQRVEVLKYTCTVCKYEMSDPSEYKTATCEKDAIGNETHKYLDSTAEVVAAGSCTEYRKVQNTCFLCQYVKVSTAEDYSHKYQKTVVEATCTTRGYTDFYCTECGDNYRGDFVEAHHNYTETVVDYTCTKAGSISYKCNDCGHSKTEVLPAAHRFEDTVVAPTCLEKGYTLHKCTECGYEEKDTYVDAAHEWSKWIVEVDATKDKDGLRHRICNICYDNSKGKDQPGYHEEVIPAIGTGGLDYYEVTTVHPQGYVAIITEGESLSTITSYHGASLHPYNSAYITINPRPSDTYNLADALSVGSDEPWTVVSDRKYTGNYSIRYVMVSDNESSKYDADVSGMAAAYRDYLKSTGTLTAIESTEENIPLYIEVLGATEVQKTILSFPVYQMTALTTFDDINTMITELGEYGINNINFRLTGFANGGLYPTVSNKVDFEDVVGGNEGYKEFAANANKLGIGVFTEFDYAYLHNTSLFDGYSDKEHAVQTIDGRYNFKKEYNPTFQMFRPTELLAISPSVFEKFYNTLSAELGELGYFGISSATLGTDLNSDFDTDDPYNREDSKKYVMELLAQMENDSNGNVMVDGGNAYTFAYANHILNMSTSSSNYLNTSASIPFISMALHGYINYAGTPTNNASNINYEVLKMIETGSNPYFLLCAQNTSALKENEELSKYYSIAYDIWMKNENTVDEFNIVDIYNKINEAMSDVQYAEYVKFENLLGERVIGEEELAEVTAANAKKLAELEEKMVAATKAFEASINLFHRLVSEGKLDAAASYYDNMGVCRLAMNDAVAAYNEFKTKLETKPGYNEKGDYVTSDYTVDDKSIVYVEYGNGIAFVLNYNNFAVTVDVNGETETVEPMSYISFKVTNN